MSPVMGMSPLVLGLLILAAFGAGWVNAVVGGGGLIMLPSLLVGVPDTVPVATVVGTNKSAQVVGNVTAGVTYMRHTRPDWSVFVGAAITAGLGALLGARLVGYMSRAVYTPVLLVVLIVVAVHTWRHPELGVVPRPERQGRNRIAIMAIGFLLGVYDGAIGPGVGTFWVLMFVSLGGYGFLQASGMAKICNSVTNLLTIISLALQGHVWWTLVWPLMAANVIGGLTGAHVAQRRGDRFIRVVFLLVVSALAVRMAVQLITGV